MPWPFYDYDPRWLWLPGAALLLVLPALLAPLMPARVPSLAALGGYFLLVHAAYLYGMWKFVSGERYVTWKPRAG